jgi:serine/threonine-protein kinase RsbW
MDHVPSAARSGVIEAGSGGCWMKVTMMIASDRAEVGRFEARLLRLLNAFGYSTHDLSVIRLAVNEALANAIVHGNQLNRSKKVLLTFVTSPREFRIKIKDEGEGFNSNGIFQLTGAEAPELRNSRGLSAMQGSMDEVRFNAKGNAVTMLRRH